MYEIKQVYFVLRFQFPLWYFSLSFKNVHSKMVDKKRLTGVKVMNDYFDILTEFCVLTEHNPPPLVKDFQNIPNFPCKYKFNSLV